MNESQEILILSLGPVFRNHVHGGSQRILRDVALYLGKSNNVTILCNSRRDNKDIFMLGENVTVKPILQFKETFPAAYNAPPYRLAFSREIIKNHVTHSDVVYMHDAGILFHDIFDDVPLVISPRDFLYPETLLGVLNFKRDKMIVTTQYMKDCVLALTDSVSDLEKKVEVIPNGVNHELFHYTNPLSLRNKLEIKDSKILLYPHRTPTKGLPFALEVTKRLISEGMNVSLLIPNYIDSLINDDVKSTYEILKKTITAWNLDSHVFIHDWISQDKMPEYYSLGDATLCLGTFPESFGNVTLESLMCGTPVIASRVAAQREVIPDSLMPKVDPFNVEEMTNLTKRFITNKPDLHSIHQYILDKYSYVKMLEGYAQVLRSFGTRIKNTRLSDFSNSSLKIAPWCYVKNDGIYNDYTENTAYPDIAAAFKNGDCISYDSLKDLVDTKRISNALSEGFIRGSNA